MTTGDKIKLLRKSKGMTQSELGERLGVKKNAVSKWECGRVEDIPAGKIKMMAEIFEVPTSYLIDDEETIKKQPADASSADELTETQKYAFDMLKTMDDSEIKLLIDIFKTVRANRQESKSGGQHEQV